MNYYIKTYGCQMNYSDSERIAGVLELAGYKKTTEENKADLIVINMCSVRKSAVNRIAGNFKKYKKYKKKNQNLKIVLTGCILKSDQERFEKLFDLVINIKDIKQLANCHSKLILESTKDTKLVVPIYSKLSATKVDRTDCSKQKITKQIQNNNDNYFKTKPKHKSKITAYVPIMTGCNNFCSYCVVPYTRGREKSRLVDEILDEIQNLVKNKYKEIILLGQNVNSYKSSIQCQTSNTKQDLNMIISSNPTIGRYNNRTISPNCNLYSEDCDKKMHNLPQSSVKKLQQNENKNLLSSTINFPLLLKLINNIPGNFWIRFLTSHPKDITKELIKTIAKCEKCTEYIHLALQSGDDEILKKMNRKYTSEHFLNLIKMIRKYIPNVAITTDIIVGFPTETEEQFQNTSEIMKKAKFDMAYINKYSPRTGTASAKLDDNVSWEEKKKREIILNKILKETALENNQKYIGKIIDTLVEKIDNNYIYGKTRSFKNVKIYKPRSFEYSNNFFQSNNIKIGEIVKAQITKAGSWGLEGKFVK